MDRRKIYKIVAEILPRIGGARKLLDLAEDAMRGGKEGSSALAELRPLLKQDDALGQIYQAINAPALEAAYRGTARERRKFTASEIPAVTQLFTPKWVVEFLLQNTLGKLWLDWHPDSRLRDKWNWISPGKKLRAASCELREKANAFTRDSKLATRNSAKDIRICDPACGTMNFGLVALEMLREMYREECPGAGGAEIDASIVRNNLIGFDIDPTAIELGRRSLEIKIGMPIREHRLSVADALFCDSPDRYDVVVTNPPYLSARNLDPAVVKLLKKRFPAAWRDLYCCFMLRGLEMLRPGGRLGILTMQSFMFTAAFEPMRRQMADEALVERVAHFGPGLFAIGNPGTLQTAAAVLRKKPAPDAAANFYRLVNADDKRTGLQKAIRSGAAFTLEQNELAALPRLAWMYWISPAVRKAFDGLPKLGNIAPPRQGLATTDNSRFVRYWWEVEPPGFTGPRSKWLPYAKGGRFRRWYESARHRVNWEDDGREIKAAIVESYPYLNGDWQWVAKNTAWYGREGITYSYLTSGAFSARRLEAGTIFDVAGSALFPEDAAATLGVLNSSVARKLLAAINPTVNFQVGDLRQLPMPREYPDELKAEVARAIQWTRELDQFDETSVDFISPPPWNGRRPRELRRSIAGAEKRIDRIVARLYGIDEEASAQNAREKPDDLAPRWISYALGVWLGRWGDAACANVAILSPLDRTLERDLCRILAQKAGEKAAAEIAARVGGLERFLGRDFLAWHDALYRGRPVFWGFCGGDKTVAISSLAGDAATLREAFAVIGQSLPRGWKRWLDDGIQINLAPLSEWIADRKLRGALKEIAGDIGGGRYGFSHTSRWMKAKISPGSSGECVRVPSPRRRAGALMIPGR